MKPNAKMILWYRWVAANALGELLGMGLYFMVGYTAAGIRGAPAFLVGILFLLVIAARVVEGVILGMAQGWAMAPYFPRLTQPAWMVATTLGVLAGWVLSSLLPAPAGMGSPAGMGVQAGSPTSQAQQFGLLLLQAAGVGALTGAALAFFQWRALRRLVHAAWIWIPANTLAWALGMPLIYAAARIIQPGIPPVQIVLALGIGILLAGAVIGAVSGVFLVRMAGQSRLE